MNDSNKLVCINLTETIVLNYVNYSILEVKVIPFDSSIIKIILSTETDQKRIVNLYMSPQDYALWNDNDQYLFDWINSQLTTTDIFST